MPLESPSDKRRGVGRHRVVRPVPAAPPAVENFPASATAWVRDYQTRAARQAVRIDLRFLGDLAHGESLVGGFWSRYGQSNYAPGTLAYVVTGLRLWARFCAERSLQPSHCSVVDGDLLRAFTAWMARRRRQRINAAAMVSMVMECLCEGADLETPDGGGTLRRLRRRLLLSCRPRRRENPKVKALADADWERLLTTARDEAARTMAGYRPSGVPESGTELIPFLVLVSAYTGANPYPLLAFQRDAWEPEPVLDGYWRVSWRKDRARGHEQQSLVFAATVKSGPSLIELLDFVRQWTAPLVGEVPENCRNDLWLFREAARPGGSAAWSPARFLARNVSLWTRKHHLDLTLGRIRASAALTLLRSGKNLTHVQCFLQHSDLNTTWKYLRSDILRPTFNRTIAATQARILGLVLPQPRAAGAVVVSDLPPVQEKLLNGDWDLGTCACRDPYHSPIEGEISGRLCRSFQACYTCPHAVWFREHLPLEVWKLRRFESLQGSEPSWAAKYGTTCEIIRRDILGAFSLADREWAEREAVGLESLPVLVASGVTV